MLLFLDPVIDTLRIPDTASCRARYSVVVRSSPVTSGGMEEGYLPRVLANVGTGAPYNISISCILKFKYRSSLDLRFLLCLCLWFGLWFGS